MKISILERGRVHQADLPAEWRQVCLSLSAEAPYAPSALAADLDSSVVPSDSDCYLAAIVASIDDEVAGFLLLRVAFSDADVDYVLVSPTRKRTGVASELLHAAQAYCRRQGIERIVLEVGVDNFAALALYEKQGFKRISLRKKYYGGKEDALILERRLPPLS